jgi:ribosome maturation factor RimP
MSVSQRVRDVVEPIVAAEGVELFDLEQAGSVLRITIDHPDGVDIDAIARVTRAVSRSLDEHDPIAGTYTLEVSSPGLERPLRTPAHFRWAAGREVSVKTVPNHPAGRRFTGTLLSADADGIALETADRPGEPIELAYGDIEKARTVFAWGPAPKPGKAPKAAKGPATATATATNPTTPPTTATEDEAS